MISTVPSALICDRFHRTIKDEFYGITFRKKLYRSAEELQVDLDAWLAKYNEQRPHSGRYCYGKTPMQQTFREPVYIAREKTTRASETSDSLQHILSTESCAVRQIKSEVLQFRTFRLPCHHHMKI